MLGSSEVSESGIWVENIAGQISLEGFSRSKVLNALDLNEGNWEENIAIVESYGQNPYHMSKFNCLTEKQLAKEIQEEWMMSWEESIGECGVRKGKRKMCQKRESSLVCQMLVTVQMQ